MTVKLIKRYLLTIVLTLVGTGIFAQDNVPLGIHYQAVARDNSGNELTNQRISVRFSIIAGDPLSAPVFQEVHQNVLTSKYGVFSLIIGHGVSTGSYKCKNLSEITWQTALHYLKVEVQFELENEFMDMGTMQFLAVPYALYAQKSLEPGPAGAKGDPGPKGDPGDPASDDQALSVVNIDGSDYLAISGGNQVKVSSIEKDGDPTNEIQDLIINTNKLKITNNASATEWDLTKYLDNTDSQALSYDAANRVLGLSGSAGTINLSELKNDADADPANEIQDLQIAGDKLSITKKTGATEINLAPYRDNTDSQQLSYSEASRTLTITGGNNVTLENIIAFRAKKLVATTAALPMSNVDFIPDNMEYNDGSGINPSTGEFTANCTGIYTFDVKYVATGTGEARTVMIYKNGNLYETIGSNISSGTTLFRTVTFKLLASDKIKMVIYTGTGIDIGTGTFSGYKVY